MESAGTPYLIDANICLGFINQTDTLYLASKKLVERSRANGSSFVLLDHVIQEILTVLLYRNQQDAIETFMKVFMVDPQVLLIDSPISWLQEATTLAKQQAYHQKMSLTDWLLLSRSLTTGIPILTFDKQLLAASKKLC